MKKLLSILLLCCCNFVARSQSQASTEGKEFWVGFLPMDIVVGTPRILISSRLGANVRVSMPLNATFIPVNVNVPANGTVLVNTLTSNQAGTGNFNSEAVTEQAYLVQSNDNDISVIASNERGTFTEASIVLPKTALGDNTEYIVVNPITTVTVQAQSFAVFKIVAVEDNTTVTVNLTANSSGGKIANTPFNVTLNKGQTVQYRVATAGEDFSGSTIKSLGTCKPFAVFAGQTQGSAACPLIGDSYQHLYEQMYPLATWGKEYIATPLLGTNTNEQTNGYFVRIIAANDNTNVTLKNGTTVQNIVLNARQSQIIDIVPPAVDILDALHIESDKPIAVLELSKATGCNGANWGNPAVVALNPINQQTATTVFNTVPTGGLPMIIAHHHVNVVMKTADIADLRFNGGTTAPSGATLVSLARLVKDKPEYSYIRINVGRTNNATAMLSVQLSAINNKSFTAFAYGAIDEFASYMYSVGATFQNLLFNFTATPQEICGANRTINFTGFGNNVLSYSWDFGDASPAGTGQNPSHTYTSTGEFTVKMTATVAAGTGCGGTDSYVISKVVKILNPPTPDLGTTNKTVCVGTNLALAVPFQANETYEWYRNNVLLPTTSNNLLVNTSSAANSGLYKVKITKSGFCSGESPEVQINIVDAPPTSVAISPASLDICAVANPLLTATAGFNYKWIRNGIDTLAGGGTWLGTATNTFVPTLTGSYTCLVSNANGCRSMTAAIVVTGSVATVAIKGENDKTVFCADKSLKLQATVTPANPSFSYQWQLKTGSVFNDILGANAAEYITSNGGTFRLRVDLAGNCTANSNELVIEKRAKPLPVATLNSLVVCQGEIVNFSTIAAPAGSDYEYSWFVNGLFFSNLQNPTYTATTSGNQWIYVKINDKNVADVCETISAPVMLAVNAAPEPIIATLGGAKFCVGQSRTLQTEIAPPSQIWTYQWFKNGTPIAGATTSSLVVSANAATGAGLYTVQLTTPPNCTRTTATPFEVTIHPLPTVAIANVNPTYCSNAARFTPTGTPAGGFFKVDGIVIQPPYSPTQFSIGTHTLRYTSQSANGCVDSTDRVFEILPATAVDITTATPPFVCSQTPPFFLNATPLGGSFSINGGAAQPYNAANTVQLNPANVGNEAQVIYSFTAANGCISRDTLAFRLLNLPEIPTSLKDVATCQSAGAVLLNAYATSHGNTVSYRWINTATGGVLSSVASLRVTQTGIYQMQITDSRGCNAATKNVKVDFDANPTVNLGADRQVCTNDPIVLNADPTNANNASFKYLWSTGATTKTLALATQTLRGMKTYWVKVTDENFDSKCATSDTINLFFNDLPVVDLGRDLVLCSPQQVPYTLVGFDISHTNQPVTYRWFNPANPTGTLATTANLNITEGGLYALRVSTPQGCSRLDTIKVDYNPNPAIRLTGFDNGGQCLLQTTLVLTLANPQNFDITWNTTNGNIVSTSTNKLSAVVNKAGRYSVKVVDKTNNARCESILFADVAIADFPLVAITPNNTDKKIVVCQDSVLTLNAKDVSHRADFRYEWRKVGNPTILATTPEFALTYAIAGSYDLQNYVVKVTPPSTCATEETIGVQFLEKAIAKIADNYPRQICLGESFTLTASGGNSYKWTSNEPNNTDVGSSATVSVKPKTAGTFTYTAEVSNSGNAVGCKSTKISVTVLVNPNLVAKVSALEKTVANKTLKFCEDQLITLDGFDISHPRSVRYAWTNASNNQLLGTTSQQVINLAVLQPKKDNLGFYLPSQVVLTVTDAATGCTNTDTLQVTMERKAKPKIQAPQQVCVGDTLVLTSNDGEQHRWNVSRFADTTITVLGGTSNSTLRIIHKTAGLQTYWVASKYNNSCTEGRDTTRIIVNPLPVAVANANKKLKVCAGDNVTLRASGGVSYVWNHGATTAETSVTVNTDSCFVVTVFNASGCKSRDTVCVKVTPIKKLPPRILLCDRETTTLDATNPDVSQPATYLWNNGYQTPKIPVFSGGVYTVKVKIGNCQYEQSCEVIYKNTPKIDLKADTLLCFALKDEVEDAPYRLLNHRLEAKLLNRIAGETYLYEWRRIGNPAVISTGFVGNDNVAPMLVGREDTDYIIRMTSTAANCSTEDTIKVRVNCTARVKIPTAFSPNGDQLNDTFAPLTSDLTGILVRVYQKWGDVIFEKFIDHNKNDNWDGIFKPEDGWDGTLNGTPVPMDKYQYVIVYWSKDRKGNTIRRELTGAVTVYRKM